MARRSTSLELLRLRIQLTALLASFKLAFLARLVPIALVPTISCRVCGCCDRYGCLEQAADAGTDYTGDFAIVQSNNFTTLFVLSREREVEDSVLDVSSLCLLYVRFM
jgi:hypothetical protein